MSDQIDPNEKKFYRCSGRECWQLVGHPYAKCKDCRKSKWNFRIKKRHMNPYLPADRQDIDDLPREDENDN